MASRMKMKAKAIPKSNKYNTDKIKRVPKIVNKKQITKNVQDALDEELKRAQDSEVENALRSK